MFSLLQLSHSGHLGGSPSHAPQLSTPVPLSRHQTQAQVTKVSAAAEFFDGISRDMSSTSRGPIQRQQQQQQQQQQHMQRLSQELSKVSSHLPGVRCHVSHYCQVRSSSPAHLSGLQRSATPSDILGRVSTPTRELITSHQAAQASRRDSAPSTVLSESFTGKT